MDNRKFSGCRRGVSTTLSYALNLAIAAILVSALLFAAGSTVQDQRQVTAREELRVIGQRIAAALQDADRMSRAGSAGYVFLEIGAPRTVAGLQYTIILNESTEQVLLRTSEPDITVKIPVSIANSDWIEQTSARGGRIYIEINQTDNSVRIGVA